MGKRNCRVAVLERFKEAYVTLVFYQFKQLMGAATQWFLSLLGFYDTFLVRGH